MIYRIIAVSLFAALVGSISGIRLMAQIPEDSVIYSNRFDVDNRAELLLRDNIILDNGVLLLADRNNRKNSKSLAFPANLINPKLPPTAFFCITSRIDSVISKYPILISAWIKPSNANLAQWISINGPDGFRLLDSSVSVSNGSAVVEIRYLMSRWLANRASIKTASAWKHCVIAITKTDIQLYIDGEFVVAQSHEWLQFPTIYSITLGGEGFIGRIDDVYVYNSNIKLEQIRQLYVTQNVKSAIHSSIANNNLVIQEVEFSFTPDTVMSFQVSSNLKSWNAVVSGNEYLYEKNGLFYCKATNQSMFFRALQNQEPEIDSPRFQNSTSNYYVFHTGSILINAPINAYPRPSRFYWSIYNPTNRSRVDLPGIFNNEIYFSRALTNYSGIYRCSATNAFGSDYKDIMLYVGVPPVVESAREKKLLTITVDPSNAKTVTSGDPINPWRHQGALLSPTVTGSSPSTRFWYRQSSPSGAPVLIGSSSEPNGPINCNLYATPTSPPCWAPNMKSFYDYINFGDRILLDVGEYNYSVVVSNSFGISRRTPILDLEVTSQPRMITSNVFVGSPPFYYNWYRKLGNQTWFYFNRDQIASTSPANLMGGSNGQRGEHWIKVLNAYGRVEVKLYTIP